MLTEPHCLSVTLPCVDLYQGDRSIYQLDWVAMTQWQIQEFLTGGVGGWVQGPQKGSPVGMFKLEKNPGRGRVKPPDPLDLPQ